MTDEKPAKTTLLLPKALHKQLRHFAIDADKSFNDVAKEALTEYLERHQVNAN